MRYAFKDRYTDYQGVDVERVFPTRFYSYAGTGTDASRQNPSRSTGTIAATSGQNQSIILGGGYHKFSVGTTSGYQIWIRKNSVYPLFEIDASRFNTMPVLGTEDRHIVMTEDKKNAILAE